MCTVEKSTLCPLKLVSATLDTVTMDENCTQNTIFLDRVMLALTKKEALTEPTETAIQKTQLIVEMKTKLREMTLA